VDDANLIIQDGYAQFTITHCSDYVLTDTIVAGVSTEEITTEPPTPTDKVEQTQSNMPMILIIGGVLLALGVLVFVLYNKKKQQS
ncbi:LPXTG cell wall anchor domain-containing protein, partial [Alkalibaculum sp. M08DMB]